VVEAALPRNGTATPAELAEQFKRAKPADVAGNSRNAGDNGTRTPAGWNILPMTRNPEQSPNVPPFKSGRDSSPKLRGASFLSDLAWHEIARTLGITKARIADCPERFSTINTKRRCQTIQDFAPHRSHAFEPTFQKLNVTSRTELVMRIVEQMVALPLSENRRFTPHLPPPQHRSLLPAQPAGQTRQLVKRNFRGASALDSTCRLISRLFQPLHPC